MSKSEKEQIAATFLSELGKGIGKEERVMVGYAKEATVQTDKDGKRQNAGWWPVSHREDKDISVKENCYVCISSSIKTPNPKTGAMRYWRGEASFGHGLALMVDDIGTGKGSKGGIGLDYFGKRLRPTATVETSPGNHQLWYFFDAPVSDRREFKAFLLSFVTQVLDKGGDSTIRDISRYGRMPVGINNKRTGDGKLKYAANADGSPFEVRLLESDYSRRYSMKRIADALGFEILLPQERVSNLDVEDLDAEAKLNQIWLKISERVLNRAKAGEGSDGEVSMNMSGKYRIMCPWGDEHSNGDPYGAYFRAQIPGAEYDYVFGCGHDGCRKDNKRTWSTFVDKIAMPYIYQDLERAAELGMSDTFWQDYMED